MLPKGHVGVVVCGTRRAAQWRALFQDAGIDAAVVETDVEEAEAGACKVGVPKARLIEANAIVTAVTKGERRLPGSGIGWQGVVVLLVVAAMIGGVVLGVAAR